MTAAVYRTTQPSLSVPHTQNTAPVLEFNCLYTHDVRRKQKRWQDGFLRFHTFNKRVMVYDVPRNFIGDTHWKADEAVQDGDEVTLEKDGVLVQVAESVGRTETDLTELRKSKNKGSSEHGSSPAKGGQTPARPPARSITQKQGTQLKHRSLNALLGTPKGPLGKAALPSKSPYEERQANAENEGWEDGRPPKRRRVEQPGAWNVTRTTKTPTASKKKEAPLWARTSDAAKQKNKKTATSTGQQRLGTKEVIELSDDEVQQDKFLPGFSSDVLAPRSSPARDRSTVKAHPNSHTRSSSPAFQTQKKPRKGDTAEKHPLTKGQALEQGAQQDEPSARSTPTTPRRDADRMGAIITKDALPESAVLPARQSSRPPKSATETVQPMEPASSRTGQTLRMTSRTSKKKTLLCQDQLTKKPSRTHSANTERAIDNLLDVTSQDDAPPDPAARSQRRLLEQRLAKIRKKSIAPADPSGVAASETISEASEGHQYAPGMRNRPQDVPADTATSLAELDQMIMPNDGGPPSPEAPPPVPLPPKHDRPLRKVVSDVTGPTAQRRAPGAPMRFTPSPSKRAQAFIAPGDVAEKSASGSSAQPRNPRAKKPLQRAVSLNTAAEGTSAVIFSKPFQTPKAPSPKVAETQKAPDPWSREAFDLFTWRPPGWDEEKWCLGNAAA